jgi:tumor protein p53-inducible protein 3
MTLQNKMAEMFQIVINNDPNFTLEWLETEIPEIDQDQVLIKTVAVGVNRADLLQRKGMYPPPKGFSEILGIELSGTIEKLGKNVKEFKLGDKVAGLVNAGAYAEYVVAHKNHIFQIPNNLSFEQAAAIPEAFLVAQINLFWEAELKKSEITYINAGASGVGLAAIQLAKMNASKVIASAGSPEKVAACEKYGADLSINYKLENVSDVITNKYGKHSVDVILDMLSGKYFNSYLSLLQTEGRIVIIAYQAGRFAEIDFAKILMKRLKIIGSTLRGRNTEVKSKLIEEFKNKYLPAFETEELKPVVDSVFNIKDANLAHTRMDENLNIGKIILKI